jgi:hypothetical protein
MEDVYTTTFSKMPSKTSMAAVLNSKSPEELGFSHQNSSLQVIGTPVFNNESDSDGGCNFSKKIGLHPK